MKDVRIGCSGWMYRDWRGVFYPEKLPQRAWLARYAEEFSTVEVNSTFYRLPKLEAVERWVEDTPRGFVFAVKGSRYLTHIKRLNDFDRYAERLFERIEPLVGAGKLGPMLWQLPGSFKRDDERLGATLEALRGRPGRHCFEFRHPSWFCEPVYSALGREDAALVIGDDPEREFQERRLTAGWTYLRLHRGPRGARGNYSPGDLEVWRRRIAAWRARTEVFAYFNNDWEGFAPRNARELGASFA